MIRETVNALAACLVTFVLCAVAYPAAVWGLGQLIFPAKAEGSLVYSRDRTVIGSELIAQPFASDRYFQPRPSAADYKADAASGSNLGTKNPDLHTKVKERTEALKATTDHPAPADLISASGSGLDPEISPESARFQADRVAAARQMPIEQVRSRIDRQIDHSGAIIGAPPRVNVLRLNLALDQEKPRVASASAPVVPDLTDDVAKLREEIGGASTRIKQLINRVEQQTQSINDDNAAREKTREELKRMEERVTRLTESSRGVSGLIDRVSGLDKRVESANVSIRTLGTNLDEARKALKGIATSPGKR